MVAQWRNTKLFIFHNTITALIGRGHKAEIQSFVTAIPQVASISVTMSTTIRSQVPIFHEKENKQIPLTGQHADNQHIRAIRVAHNTVIQI